MSNLKKLNLQNNRLSGEIPKQLGRLKKLVELHLNNNQLVGDVSDTLDALEGCNDLMNIYLQKNLDLKDDKIKFGEPVKGLPKLRWLHTQFLQPRGTLGADARVVESIWKALGGDETKLMNGAKYNVCEWANVKVEEGRVTCLDWSKQDLWGVIPNDEIGKLKGLKVLNLAQNRSATKTDSASEATITGNIPQSLGALTFLESLNLEGNMLSGPIPRNLKFLTNLKKLYLNDNELTGEFPEELGELDLKILHLHANKLYGTIPQKLDKNSELGLNELKYEGNGNDSNKEGQNELKSPIRQGPITNEVSALMLCWKAMGGDDRKDILHNGEPKDHSKWKGVTVTGYRVTEIGESEHERSASLNNNVLITS